MTEHSTENVFQLTSMYSIKGTELVKIEITFKIDCIT